MIRLFKAEAWRDFEERPSASSFTGNGTIILQPYECYCSAQLNSAWQIDISHYYDNEGRYTYIEKNDVLVVDVKIAREQTSPIQYFRVMSVKRSDNDIQIMGYPVALESIFECPIDSVKLQEFTPDEVIDYLDSAIINTNKYTLDLQYHSDVKSSISISNSNLQELLNGDQDGTFKSQFATELVYDNYTYHILPYGEVGSPAEDAKKYKIIYGTNLASSEFEESTVDMVTRIYPTSYEGYGIRSKYVETTDDKLKAHPFVYAKSVNYSDIKLVDIRSETDDDPDPWTKTQMDTKNAKAIISAKVQELSEKFLKKARNGDWDHNYTYLEWKSNNPHEPDTGYNLYKDRASLPFGYIFYSYTDAIGVLADRVIHADLGGGFNQISGSQLIGENESSGFIEDDDEQDEEDYMVFTDTNFRTLIQDAIKEGFKWCETTEIAGWDWHADITYTDPTYDFLDNYYWIEDDHGWYYGDGNGHYIQNGWVEDAKDKHYWIGDDGYWDPQYDDTEPWYWWSVGQKWWYGTKDNMGHAVNYAKEQYIKDTESGHWYWFNGDGWFVDGDSKLWWYGTDDKADTIMFKYWKIGSHIWWFNSGGYISTTLQEIDKFEWRTDETGNYYGDGAGHWFSSAWVEDSSSSHRWLNDQGYEDESKKDTDEWSWHGSWENGWWYGSDEDEEEEESSSSNTSTKKTTREIVKNINDICEDADQYTKDAFVGLVSDELDRTSYSEASTLGQIDAVIKDTTASKNNMVNRIQVIINNSGYLEDDDDDPSEESDTSPSGETNVSTDSAKNFVKNQFLYVTENKTWYWFDEEGYMTAAWLVDEDWEWHQDSVGWWYGDGKGTYPQGQWMKINSKWYFFGMSGYADSSTDDFEESKTSDSNSASYDSNREGIGSSATKESIDDVVYDRDREGVKAWIQDEFVREVYTTCLEQWEWLYGEMEAQLEAAAEADLSYMDQPAVSLTVNMENIYNTTLYQQYAFLNDLYLGDHVYVINEKTGVEAIERVVSIKKDCISNKVAEIEFETEAYSRNKTKLIPGLANTVATTGKVIKYEPENAIEDGWGGFVKTGYGVNLNSL